jgi:alcohol dehydrogenase class IV
LIVRWGIDALPDVLRELAIERPLLVTSRRWAELELPISHRYTGVRSHAPVDTVEAALEEAAGADAVVGLGGGSAIDTAKAVSSLASIPVVSVPTTYAGAEWTPYFGMRDEARRLKTGGTGAELAAAVYEPRLTLGLPREETAGTAMNALAHCAEALYVDGHNEEADTHALTGARLIREWLPRVLERTDDLEARTHLLEGAMHAGAALGKSGLALGHAMAQALGGRYGLPHGALNAIVLPAALRFNAPAAADALRRLGAALDGDPVERGEELARLGGFTRLRDLGVPDDELAEVAEATAARAGAKANPRPASPADIDELLRSVW